MPQLSRLHAFTEASKRGYTPPRSPRLKLRTDSGCTGRTYLHDLHIVRHSAGLALEPVSFDETAAWRRSQLPDTDTDPTRCTCAEDGYTDRARLARCGIVQYSYLASYCRACLSVDVLLNEGTNRDCHGYITDALGVARDARTWCCALCNRRYRA